MPARERLEAQMKIGYAFRRNTFYPFPGSNAGNDLPPRDILVPYLKRVRALGFEGIEVGLERQMEDEGYVRELRAILEGEGVPAVAEHADIVYAADSTPIEGRSDGLALTAPSTGATRPRRRNGVTSRRRQRYQPPRPALPFSEIATVAPCPDCSNSLVFAEGCLSCRLQTRCSLTGCLR